MINETTRITVNRHCYTGDATERPDNRRRTFVPPITTTQINVLEPSGSLRSNHNNVRCSTDVI